MPSQFVLIEALCERRVWVWFSDSAVVLMEVDADVKRHAWLVCGLTHSLPFYTIGFMRFGSSK
jgi:hypothetical protein